jgi:hypothetical protein
MKLLNIKFYETPLSGSRVVADVETDMEKPVCSFLQVFNAHAIEILSLYIYS